MIFVPASAFITARLKTTFSVVRRKAGKAVYRLHRAGHGFFKLGQDVQAYFVSGVAVLEIRRIVDERNFVFFDIVIYFLARTRNQRMNYSQPLIALRGQFSVGYSLHARKRAAARKVEKHGFRIVVHVVGGCDRVDTLHIRITFEPPETRVCLGFGQFGVPLEKV